MTTVTHNPPEPRYPTAECTSCSAPIIWAWTRNARKLPVDAEAVAPNTGGGNILLSMGGGRVLAEVVTNPAKLFGRTVYRSHFSTCPFADRHRHPRTRRAGS